MDDALAEDRRALESAESWLLGRFVCPASRLGELGSDYRTLTVVVDAELPVDDRIVSVEAREPVPFDGDVYVELPLDDSLSKRLDELQARGLRAKVRCGGDSVPHRADLARFIRGCRSRGLVFKATAGLHHAYPTNGEHGFLNLLAAVIFDEREAALTENEEEAFRLDEGEFAWRGFRAGPEELAAARRDLFSGIGSCSFTEPVEELERLGML